MLLQELLVIYIHVHIHVDDLISEAVTLTLFLVNRKTFEMKEKIEQTKEFWLSIYTLIGIQKDVEFFHKHTRELMLIIFLQFMESIKEILRSFGTKLLWQKFGICDLSESQSYLFSWQDWWTNTCITDATCLSLLIGINLIVYMMFWIC